ncbi:helix-turn-helix transcriptional regulator [Marinobacterium stanieri]|uniref:AraC-type DNA-binding protein n=1 Tax=Marinobacterium stanieri TaxID=49186 RepID=A0A1N6NJG1_9GAMM|nr:response regulator transcription factor [Marinobacterium stanieri]SIP92258.1 AraC-type DNA-binding protein [Marinobacterium stanieri]
MSQAGTPKLLWLDLRGSERSSTLLGLFCERFQIDFLDPYNPEVSLLEQPVMAICFDFDYPDMHGLTLMRELYQRYQLPEIMMTEQHSEALMVWALRARVWEILLKPMQRSTAEFQLDSLQATLISAQAHREELHHVSTMLRLPEESRFRAANAEQNAVHPALSYMQLHLGEKMSEELLAKFCNLRPLQFSRLFKKAYGVTFQELLQQLRMQEASHLLTNPDRQILDVALSVGYRDHSYFCRVFKKYMGVTPKTYQEQQVNRSEKEQQAAIAHRLTAVANLAGPLELGVREGRSG